MFTEGDWYSALLKDKYTIQEGINEEKVPLKCRVERAQTNLNWENIWRLIRLPGLGPEYVSFLFKLVHDILVTQERLSRINPGTSATCKIPGCSTQAVEDQVHALVTCEGNNGAGNEVMKFLRHIVPDLGVEAALRLDVRLDEALELPFVRFSAAAFQAIWELRSKGKKVELYKIRSQIESKICLLRKTSHINCTTMLDILVKEL